MIKVILEHRTIGVSFRHSDVEATIPGTIPPASRQTKGTFCEIFEIKKSPTSDVEYATWVAEASAVVGIGDQFRKDIGRKLSLTRVLKYLSNPKYGEQKAIPPLVLTKADRVKIWAAYHRRGEIKGKFEPEVK
jgi:hypothetical protein